MDKYYLIGIKGSGMSALAKILSDLGYIVLGCDIEENFYTCDSLSEILIDNIDNIKLSLEYTYVIGNAYKDSRILLKLKKYKVISYELLIDSLFNNVNIAISGTHGKTTVTKFVSSMLDCSYLIGDGEGSGKSDKYFVYEACEYKEHFLTYNPDILLVNNIDFDHPDYYLSLEDTYNSFCKLSRKCNLVITNGDYYYTKKLVCNKMITYGFSLNNDCVCSYKKVIGGYLLNIKYLDEETEVLYKYYGIHMIYNFLSVYTLLRYLGFNNKYIIDNINNLELPKRRSTIFFKNNNYYICDYAHHPNEISCFYESLVENNKYNGYKLVIIFEPHTISRLLKFKDEFKEVLSKFDETYLYPLFTSVREKEDLELIEELYKYLGFSLYDEYMKFNKSIICYVGAGVIDKEYMKKCYEN